MKNCDAMCDAHQISAPLHLWLRNKTFYSRIELPRINGKRRYKRVSLHTSNYYEARAMMAEQQELLNDIKELRQLYRQIDFEDSGFPYTPSPSQTTVFTPYLKTIPIVRKISSSNSNSLLSRVWSLFKKLEGHQKQLPNDIQTMIVEIRASKEVFDHKIHITIDPNSKKDLITPQLIKSAQSSTVEIPSFPSQITEVNTQPTYTIKEIFDGLIQKTQNQESSNIRKKNALVKMLAGVGLTIDDDYSKFNNAKIINQIGANILALENVNSSGKRNRKALIEALVNHAHLMEPTYPINSIASLPTIKADICSEISDGHLAYEPKQLLDIFDPKYSVFRDNPDLFWICAVGLFTGARANAAITLQYKDIINEKGMDCIFFQLTKDDKAKHYKNKATVRKVPIHKQLLDLGFLDYIKRKQAKRKAAPTDYIYSPISQFESIDAVGSISFVDVLQVEVDIFFL